MAHDFFILYVNKVLRLRAPSDQEAEKDHHPIVFTSSWNVEAEIHVFAIRMYPMFPRVFSNIFSSLLYYGVILF
jgi:hypothetical protein